MITLVDGKGEQVNDTQFQNWDDAESFLWEQRENGARGLYLHGNLTEPATYDGVYFIVVGFADSYSMVIKAKHIPFPDEIMEWIKPDMEKFG